MQMGLRSILIEVNTKISEVKKHTATSTLFENRSNYIEKYYEEWFSCPDLSTIYEQGSWYGDWVHSGGVAQGTGTGNHGNRWDRPPTSSTLVSRT